MSWLAFACGLVIMPPAEYQNPKFEARIIWMGQWDVDGTCRASGYVGPGRLEACTGRDKIGWFQVLPKDTDEAHLACLITHETAHLPPHPWPWYHPGGFYK